MHPGHRVTVAIVASRGRVAELGSFVRRERAPRMATLEKDRWMLDNAESRHVEAPDTFQIPSRAKRLGLPIGQMVQLLFLFLNAEPDGSPVIDCEKMWVTIQEIAGGRYRGQLESLPHTSTALAPLDRIEFVPEHGTAVFIRRSDARHTEFRAEG